MTTSIPEAIDLLLDALEQADYTSCVEGKPQILLGLEADLEDVAIIVGGGDGSDEWGAIGAKRRDGEYRIELAVSVAVPEDTAREAKDRAWAIWQVVYETVLEQHIQFREGGTGVLFSQMGDLRWGPSVLPVGFGHEIQGAVRFTATDVRSQ